MQYLFKKMLSQDNDIYKKTVQCILADDRLLSISQTDVSPSDFFQAFSETLKILNFVMLYEKEIL
jgi:hypothetical protein